MEEDDDDDRMFDGRKVDGEKRTESERDGIASRKDFRPHWAVSGQWARARQEEFGNEPVQIGLRRGVDITSL